MADFATDLQVRFRDVDSMGHVNNAVYASYLEQARVEFYTERLDADLATVDSVLAHLEIDYERPIELGQAVRVTVDVPELGRTSIPMDYEVLADGAVAATASTVQVLWDRETRETRPIPEDWRARIESDGSQ